MNGPDHKASLSQFELCNYIKKLRLFYKSLGEYEKKPYDTEIKISKITVRRSHYILILDTQKKKAKWGHVVLLLFTINKLLIPNKLFFISNFQRMED